MKYKTESNVDKWNLKGRAEIFFPCVLEVQSSGLSRVSFLSHDTELSTRERNAAEKACDNRNS